MRDARPKVMGNWEADHASPMGAPTDLPMGHHPEGWGPPGAVPAPAPALVSDERPRQNTPLWMETSTAHPEVRRGAAPPARSGLHTLVFFGLIIFVVGAAGIGGVALWGPEKPIKNRTQFATNPPPPVPLPSLPVSAAPLAAAPVEAAPAPVESSQPAEAQPPKKAKKKTPRSWKKTR